MPSKTRVFLRPVALLVVLVLVASACSSDGSSLDAAEGDDLAATDSSIDATVDSSDRQISLTSGGDNDLLGVRLSEGKTPKVSNEPRAITEGEDLTAAEVAAILARTFELDADPTDQTDFNRPTESLPAPRTGETVAVAFPPADNASVPDVATGALEVLRFQPEGPVAVAPFVSVTFNQPMVPLSTITQLDALEVPVTITPELPGRWQWIGTKTLRFEHDPDIFDRLPAATEYTVEIPAGTTAAAGSQLAETFSWSFSTPPVGVVEVVPANGATLELEPLFFVRFDQTIDPAAVLETISLTANNDEFALRLATADEVESDRRVSKQASKTSDDRWLAFRAQGSLPRDAQLRVAVGPGVASAEGPRLNESTHTWEARTFPQLAITEHQCGYGDGCQPGSEFTIRFNNLLDRKAFEPSLVSIEPPVPGVRIGVSGNAISISGNTTGGTTYEVTVSEELIDVFGQSFGDDTVVNFEVGKARPALGGFNQALVTLDPLTESQTLTISSINHESLRVRTFSVSADGWAKFIALPDRKIAHPDWELLFDTTIEVEADEDSIGQTIIDLADSFAAEPGHVVVLVEATGALAQLPQHHRDYWNNQPLLTWVQSTTLGVDAIVDGDQMVVWTTDLRSGEPIEGVEVDARFGDPVVTDSDGIATLVKPSRKSYLTAELDGETAILSAGRYPGQKWERWHREDALRWYVFDDRGLYKPGETVRLKGWVRRKTLASDANLELLPAGTKVDYRVIAARKNKITSGTLELSNLGGFDLEFEIPLGVNLGKARVVFEVVNTDIGKRADGLITKHKFRIDEFRRPEFEAVARPETAGPYLFSSSPEVAVEAFYFAGGPLPNAAVSWTVTTNRATYSPPNWDGFTFGTWTPWWFDGAGRGRGEYQYFDYEYQIDEYGNPPGVETFEGTTGSDGTHYLRMDFEAGSEPNPVTVTASATVLDINRQAWSSSTSLLVHPAELYVGLRSERTFVARGEPLLVEAIVTNIDGKAVAERNIVVEAARREWVFVDGDWTTEDVDVQVCEVTTGDEPVLCRFDTEQGGEYVIASTIVDDLGQENRSELTRWVSGGRQRPQRDVEQEVVTLIPDKAEYRPGDVAEILVESPFSPAEGLLTISRNGIRSTEHFSIDGDSTVLEIPIDESHVPSVSIQVDLAGTTERTTASGEPLPDAPRRPAFAVGSLNLSVPPLTRTLTVTAEPRSSSLEPGAATTIDVLVVDDDGQAVSGSEVALVVVDEAVLGLTGYQLPDPLALFYDPIRNRIETSYGRSSIVLADLRLLLTEEQLKRDQLTPDTSAPLSRGLEFDTMEEEAAEDDEGGDFAQADSAGAALFTGNSKSVPSEQAPQVDVRDNFDALALFAPRVITDASGKAQVDLELPDSLTRYRVMAVAVDGNDRFGSGEANLTARLPLMVRPSAPRFLNFGDRFELPVVIQNQTDEQLTVEVAIAATNLELPGPAGKRVTVAANDRVEVRFPAAADLAGTARFQVVAVSDELADAASIDLPVYTPATAEAFASYGVLDSGSTIQAISPVSDVYPEFGGLEITTSSTAVQSLTDAVLYLSEYPYQTSDALASRILAIVALRDVLQAFEADGLPTPEKLQADVQRDINKLLALQNDNGGFAHWQKGKPSEPYNSVQATHALIEANKAGFLVREQPLAKALKFVRSIEKQYPKHYPQRTRDSINSYALNVLFRNGEANTAKAQGIYSTAENLSLEATAWLWPVLVADGDSTTGGEIARLFNNRAAETAAVATFATDYGEDGYLLLHSNRRTDAVILGALIEQRPGSDLIAKVVEGLLAGRTRGRWNSIQENTFVLQALNEYFNTFEAQTPDFVARMWLGDIYAGEHEYRGRSANRALSVVAMDELIEQLQSEAGSDIVISKDGPGRLYYRLGLKYAPDDLELDPLDRGFVVQRSYEAVDDPDDVRRADDGTWHIEAGARVRVRLSMVADSRRTHVALIDPLPAGLESINPSFATTEQIPADDDATRPRWRNWFRHQNLRDDRTEAFTRVLRAGTYEYTYVARATTPGTFITPPARAEEMYSPETFGRSASAVVIVEDPT